MNQSDPSIDARIVDVRNMASPAPVVVVCEHASRHIPPTFSNLGLADADLAAHVVWDPGALEVAERLAERLGATLIAGRISRLVYDCNRPPEAPDAIPARSEVIDIPGNAGLSATNRDARAQDYYHPFRMAVAEILASKTAPVLVTVHSFTPVYHGRARTVEIGIVHDSDARLADALLSDPDLTERHVVQRNAPYGPDDGVTHTLRAHALPRNHLNVMLEIRNDLIAEEGAQHDMADLLADALARALEHLEVKTCSR